MTRAARLSAFRPLLVVALATLVAACTATDAPPSSSVAASAAASPEPSEASTPDPTPLPSFGPFSGTVTVQLKDYDFQLPTGTKEMTITAGTTVLFENVDGRMHTATHGVDGHSPAGGGLFDIPLEDGESASFTFEEPGSYGVTCKPHTRMNVTIEAI